MKLATKRNIRHGLWLVFRPRNWLFLFLVALVLGGFYFLSILGPRTVADQPIKVTVEETGQMRQLRKASEERLAAFEALTAMRKPTREDLAVLKESIELLDAYIEALPMRMSAVQERRDALETRWHEENGRLLYEESRALEARAEAEFEAGNLPEAQLAYRRAHALQVDINLNYPRADTYNVGRATRLNRRVRFMSAEPLFRDSLAEEKAARADWSAEAWLEATRHMQNAIDLQERLNREFRMTPQADPSRLAMLRSDMVALRSSRSAAEIDRQIDAAETAMAESAFAEAATHFQEARRLQRALNETFPGSPFASPEAVNRLEGQYQTALSQELIQAILRRDRELDLALAGRETFRAGELIDTLLSDLETLEANFPRSAFQADALSIKLTYLSLLKQNLGSIQDRIYRQLLPIPGDDGWLMIREEIRQGLYQRMMGDNPSPVSGEQLPVVGVNLEQTRVFCQRLGWILGKPVRLPTRSQFTASVGSLRYIQLEVEAWGHPNASGELQPVGSLEANAAGFHDLLGNAREWVLPDPTAETFRERIPNRALLAGGSAEDPFDRIIALPFVSTDPVLRDPYAGFRIVVAREPDGGWETLAASDASQGR
ncbi:MAG: formylglycine-generating enzyme family protein [Opitutales bacterium]